MALNSAAEPLTEQRWDWAVSGAGVWNFRPGPTGLVRQILGISAGGKTY